MKEVQSLLVFWVSCVEIRVMIDNMMDNIFQIYHIDTLISPISAIMAGFNGCTSVIEAMTLLSF